MRGAGSSASESPQAPVLTPDRARRWAELLAAACRGSAPPEMRLKAADLYGLMEERMDAAAPALALDCRLAAAKALSEFGPRGEPLSAAEAALLVGHLHGACRAGRALGGAHAEALRRLAAAHAAALPRRAAALEQVQGHADAAAQEAAAFPRRRHLARPVQFAAAHEEATPASVCGTVPEPPARRPDIGCSLEPLAEQRGVDSLGHRSQTVFHHRFQSSQGAALRPHMEPAPLKCLEPCAPAAQGPGTRPRVELARRGAAAVAVPRRVAQDEEAERALELEAVCRAEGEQRAAIAQRHAAATMKLWCCAEEYARQGAALYFNAASLQVHHLRRCALSVRAERAGRGLLAERCRAEELQLLRQELLQCRGELSTLREEAAAAHHLREALREREGELAAAREDAAEARRLQHEAEQLYHRTQQSLRAVCLSRGELRNKVGDARLAEMDARQRCQEALRQLQAGAAQCTAAAAAGSGGPSSTVAPQAEREEGCTGSQADGDCGAPDGDDESGGGGDVGRGVFAGCDESEGCDEPEGDGARADYGAEPPGSSPSDVGRGASEGCDTADSDGARADYDAGAPAELHADCSPYDADSDPDNSNCSPDAADNYPDEADNYSDEADNYSDEADNYPDEADNYSHAAYSVPDPDSSPDADSSPEMSGSGARCSERHYEEQSPPGSSLAEEAEGDANSALQGSRDGSVGSEIAAEPEDEYGPGGYHPVEEGDTLRDGRYVTVAKLGSGFYSTVWLAVDTREHNNMVALKIVKAAHTATAEIEESMLRVAGSAAPGPGAGNQVVGIIDDFREEGPHGTHMVMVLPVMGAHLQRLVSGRGYRGLDPLIVKVVTLQVLQGLQHLHDCVGVVHTDLKPENILLAVRKPSVLRRMQAALPPELRPTDEAVSAAEAVLSGQYELPRDGETLRDALQRQYRLAIGDLGCARFLDAHYEPGTLNTTAEYRSPEGILGYQQTGAAMDIWSLACIVFELLTGEYLFHCTHPDCGPDRDEFHLILFVETLGALPQSMVKGSAGVYAEDFFTDGRFNVDVTEGCVSLIKRLQDCGCDESEAEAAGDFLKAMLVYDPLRRPRARDLLSHPWLHIPDRLPDAPPLSGPCPPAPL